jgi:hypothetical protein
MAERIDLLGFFIQIWAVVITSRIKRFLRKSRYTD